MEQDAEDELLAELRALVAERPPEDVVEAAKGAYAWRTIDAELAELVRDSALEPAGAVRGDEGPRLLTFEVDDVTVEVEVGDDRDRRRVVGQVVPPQPARVEVVHSGTASQVVADDLGRFTATDVAGGPVRLRLTLDDGRTVETAWVVM